MCKKKKTKLAPWRENLHEIIFEADTFWGRAFDVFVLLAIVVSVISISLETLQVEPFQSFRDFNGVNLYDIIEWTITILFTVEFLLRIICVRHPTRYIFSFFGIVDLLSILPSYLLFMGINVSKLGVLRSLRLLRIFRVMRLNWLANEAEELRSAVWASRAKVVVFLATICIAVTISGSVMYELEHTENPQFSSIPQSMYWAVVTMTTVGYGDMFPTTALGKTVAAILILLGYSLIIVPTGFVAAEAISLKKELTTYSCSSCMTEGHDRDAIYCKYCGETM